MTGIEVAGIKVAGIEKAENAASGRMAFRSAEFYYLILEQYIDQKVSCFSPVAGPLGVTRTLSL